MILTKRAFKISPLTIQNFFLKVWQKIKFMPYMSVRSIYDTFHMQDFQ